MNLHTPTKRSRPVDLPNYMMVNEERLFMLIRLRFSLITRSVSVADRLRTIRNSIDYDKYIQAIAEI